MHVGPAHAKRFIAWLGSRVVSLALFVVVVRALLTFMGVSEERAATNEGLIEAGASLIGLLLVAYQLEQENKKLDRENENEPQA